MTPLTRWVFLVPLLGLAASLPAHIRDDACVWLCHAQASSEEHGGGCSHERIVLQSDSDRSQARRLLCLIPCRESEGLPVFEGSRDCVDLRGALIAARECSCWPRKGERRAVDHGFGEYVEEQPAITWRAEDWVKSLLEGLQRFKRTGVSLKEDPEDRSSGSMKAFDWRSVLEGRVGGSSRFRNALAPNLVVKKDSPPGGKTEVPGMEEVDDMGMEEEEEEEEEVDVGHKETHTGTTKDPNSSEEGHIDWDMWCMAQCDNGQGGSACNCDIIP